MCSLTRFSAVVAVSWWIAVRHFSTAALAVNSKLKLTENPAGGYLSWQRGARRFAISTSVSKFVIFGLPVYYHAQRRFLVPPSPDSNRTCFGDLGPSCIITLSVKALFFDIPGSGALRLDENPSNPNRIPYRCTVTSDSAHTFPSNFR